MNEPRDHHIVPQFYLRNFAHDDARSKLWTVGKDGNMAVWKERSIKGLGFERDFYVHMAGGKPVSVETEISRSVETPISQSDTWAKIASGRSDALDPSDRPILYALVRHLEARTPHYRQLGQELTAMADDSDSPVAFSDEERAMYAARRADPELDRAMFNKATLNPFDPFAYDGSLIMVTRVPCRLRTMTTPAIPLSADPHPAIAMPLPGMVPFQRVLALDPFCFVTVIVGDFDGYFANFEAPEETARGLNRTFAAHFSHFPTVRHLIGADERLVEDMTWAPWEVVSNTPRKIVFRGQEGLHGHSAYAGYQARG